MSKHSVKVPRLYKVAATILKAFHKSQGSVKTLVYEAKKKHPNVKALFALVTECLKYEQSLQKVFDHLDILAVEKPLDRDLALILATELIFGKKALPGESKPVLTLLKYQDKLNELIDVTDIAEAEVKNPRFVRVNLLKTSVDLITSSFVREGYKLRSKHDKYEDFIESVKALEEFEFMVDFHLPYLLIFPPGTHFYEHPLYLDGSLVLQDKASCFTLAALNPPPGCVLLDACAAPGMKTSQALAMICQDGNGQVIAVERNFKRFKVLEELLGKHADNMDRVKAVHGDFLQLNPNDFLDVNYMVIDPTCSGSGLSGVKADTPDAERLSRLSNLQKMILKHALKFPNVKKVAYSTCSVYAEENERVVEEVLRDVKKQFKLASNVLPTWSRRGQQGYEKCVRVDPILDLCTGFFVAVFVRRK